MNPKTKPCTQNCKLFRCGQGSLYFEGSTAWCKFVDDECEIRTCKYAQCARERLMSQGNCGIDVQRLGSYDISPEELLRPIRVPPKLAQRLKERELY